MTEPVEDGPTIIGRQLEDMAPETAAKAREALRLRVINQDIKNQLDRLGADPETTNARLEHFGQALVFYGVLTEDQLWTINLEWETMLRTQLLAARENLRNAIAQAQARQTLLGGPGVAKSRIIRPGG